MLDRVVPAKPKPTLISKKLSNMILERLSYSLIEKTRSILEPLPSLRFLKTSGQLPRQCLESPSPWPLKLIFQTFNSIGWILLLTFLGQFTKTKMNTRNLFNLQLTPLWMNLMKSKFTIDKESLRKNFYSEDLALQRKWFFQNYQGTNKIEIQEKFYEFLDKVKQNILFFDWFHAYSVIKGNDYP